MTPNRQPTRTLNNIIFGLSIIGLLWLSILWRGRVLALFEYGYDEGIHLIVAKLWAAGYTPYSEIFVSYPPIFLWSLGVPWDVFQGASSIQWLMVGYTLLSVVAVIYLGTVYHSRLAGLAAGLMLSFAPPYFTTSFTIMTETPSISLAVAAIALSEKYRRSGGWGWALAAGVTLGLGLSLKILPVYALPMVGLMALARHLDSASWAALQASFTQTRSILLRDIVIMSAGFLVIFVLPVLFFDLPAFYHQVVGMRLESREAQVLAFGSNNRMIINFLFANAGLAMLALYGAVFVIAGNPARYGWLAGWLGLIWLSMFLHIPLREKHLPIFLPVLALIAGLGVDHIIHLLKRLPRQAMTLKKGAMLLVILITLGLFFWDVPQIIARNNGADGGGDPARGYQEAIKLIQHVTPPGDCVIADDPVFLHYTHRLPPPQLAETSQTRIDTGFLSLTEVVNGAERYDCPTVAVVTDRFGKSMPGLPAWLAENYLAVYRKAKISVYFGKKRQMEDITITQGADSAIAVFENGLTLQALETTPTPLTILGGHIALHWALTAPLESHDEQRLILRQADTAEVVYETTRPFFEGRFNPADWHVGESIQDAFWFALPADLPPGDYNLYLMVCDPETGACLGINDSPGQQMLHLGMVRK